MKPTLRLLSVVLILSVLLSACAVVSRNALLGKWSEAQAGLTMEFTSDGRVRLSSQGMTIEITYQFKSDNVIILTNAQALGLANATEEVPFTINGDTLTLTISGQETKLTRVK